MRQLSKKIKLFFILSFIFASLHTHNHEEHHEHEANEDNFEINCLLCDLVKKSTVDVKVFLSNYHIEILVPSFTFYKSSNTTSYYPRGPPILL
jgi:hypothetical protein